MVTDAMIDAFLDSWRDQDGEDSMSGQNASSEDERERRLKPPSPRQRISS